VSETPLPQQAQALTPRLSAADMHWDKLLDEALASTFPASDPVAANRFD
jgi:hypothetical protein